MKITLCITAAVILTLACGETESASSTAPEGLEIDTLAITDSIGVLMGDSCYMIGSILKAEAIPGGDVILFDRSTGLISIFDENCEFIMSFGGLGEAPGKFNLPGAMTVLGDGRIAAFDWMDKEICFFSLEGEYLGSRPNPGFEMPLSMSAAGDSCFVVYSCPTHRIEDTFMMGYEVNLWEGTSEEPQETLFSHLFDFGKEGYDFRPGYLTVTAGSEKIYLHRMNSQEYLIEEFDLNGQLVDTIVSENVLVPQEEIKRFVYIPIASFMVQDENGDGQQLSGELTEFSPQVENLGIDSLGNLWAQRGNTEEIIWDIFSPDGELVRHAVLCSFPDSAMIHVEINENGIVAWDLFPEDYPRLYRLDLK